MSPVRSLVRTWSVLALFGVAACSGSINCNGCGGNMLLPIPGGFDPAAQIEHGAQLRVTTHGFDFIDGAFHDLLSAYLTMQCGGMNDVPCPTDFLTNPGSLPNPSTCDAVDQVCVEQASGVAGPLVGFEIPYTSQSSAIICRDDPNDSNRRRCFAWLRLEALHLAPLPPDQIQATVTAQIYSNDIPFRYDPLGMDCVVQIDSARSGSILQDFVITARVTEWTPPSGSGGRQLKIVVDSVDAMIPDMDINITRDPILGGFDDTLSCGFANLGFVKNALVPRLTGSLAGIVGDEVAKALGMKCTGPNPATCPAQTSCNSNGLCEEDASGDIVPTRLGIEGRMDFSTLLGGLTAGRPGQGDVSFLVGGQSGTDNGGLSIGMLGGAEVVTPDPTCAMVLPSPRLRPGWMAPPLLPTDDAVDLDFDGTRETPYMVAAGVSNALLDQFLWTIYTDGLFCQSVSAYDVDLLNTGSLALLMPSLAQLTHSDRYRYAIFPARVSLHPLAEPRVTIGAGKIDRSGPMPVLSEPLLDIFLHDLQVNFFALIEERWVRLMTVTLDMHIGLGASVTPSNAIQPVIGDLSHSISNVRVSNSELLAEDPMDLEMSIPSLIQLALPQVTAAIPAFALPNGMDLGGFELTVLGIRGVEGATAGVYPNLGIYANLGFNPALVPHLEVASETAARVLEVRLPPPDRFSVTAPGGPDIPEVELAISGQAPSGKELEAQVRIDGSLWSPFFVLDQPSVVLRRPEFLAQGHHRIDVRTRVAGDYRSLDPSPVALDVVIDAEPPRIDARLAIQSGGIFAGAYDVVSKENVRLELGVGNAWRNIIPDENGFVPVAAIDDPNVRIAVAATDEMGLRRELVLREGRALAAAPQQETGESGTRGCTCVAAPIHESDATKDESARNVRSFLALLSLLLVCHGRRLCTRRAEH